MTENLVLFVQLGLEEILVCDLGYPFRISFEADESFFGNRVGWIAI